MNLVPHNLVYQARKPYYQEYYRKNKARISENQRKRLKNRPRICVICQKEVPKERKIFKIKTCSVECSNKNTKEVRERTFCKYARNLTKKRQLNIKCLICLTSIKFIEGRYKYCSEECSNAYTRVFAYIYKEQKKNPTWFKKNNNIEKSIEPKMEKRAVKKRVGSQNRVQKQAERWITVLGA